MNTNEEQKTVRRGEIYLYDMKTEQGSIQRGRRPVLVLQDTQINKKSPVTVVAAITSVIKKPGLPSHVYLGARFGLVRDSQVLLEQLMTVNQADLIKKIGFVNDPAVMYKIRKGLAKQLRLKEAAREQDIRCLCPRCANDYRYHDTYIVKRVDPYNNTKESCQKCGRPGYDYFVYSKSQSGKEYQDGRL